MPSWVLPWPPVTTNHLYQRCRNGGVRLNLKAQAWREEVIVLVRQSGQRLPEGQLAATIHLWCPPLKFPRTKHPDVDGPIKLILDAVFAAFDDDDNRLDRLLVFRDEGGANPRVEVQVEPRWTAEEAKP